MHYKIKIGFKLDAFDFKTLELFRLLYTIKTKNKWDSMEEIIQYVSEIDEHVYENIKNYMYREG